MGQNLCALGSGLATAWLVVCLRKATAAPLPILVLANLLVALAGLPFLEGATLAPVHWGLLLVAGVGQLGISTVLYGRAMPHVRAIEAIMIPSIEPVLNPLGLAAGRGGPEWLGARGRDDSRRAVTRARSHPRVAQATRGRGAAARGVTEASTPGRLWYDRGSPGHAQSEGDA